MVRREVSRWREGGGSPRVVLVVRDRKGTWDGKGSRVEMSPTSETDVRRG